MMGGGGVAMPGWVMLAVPVMLMLTAGRALVAAARKPGGTTRSAAIALAGIGTLTTALILWSENIVLSLGGDASAYFGGLLPWLLGDLILLGVIWAGLAALVVRAARHWRRAE